MEELMLLSDKQIEDMLANTTSAIRESEAIIDRECGKLVQTRRLLEHLQKFCTHRDDNATSLIVAERTTHGYIEDRCSRCGFVEEVPF
jgi:hypothetical protein